MGTLQHELTNPSIAGQQRPARRSATATPPPTPRSAKDILAEAKARAEARRQRAMQSANPSTVELIVALLETRDFLRSDYEDMDRNRQLYPNAAAELAELQKEIGQNEVELKFYLNPQQQEGENNAVFEGRKHQLHLSVEEATRRLELRNAAYSWTESIRAMESPDAKVITSMLENPGNNIGPFLTDVPKDAPNHVATWKGRHLGSSVPEDEVVTGVVTAFGEAVSRFINRKEQEEEEVVTLLSHAGYFIHEDEVDKIRKSAQSVNLTRFLGNGEGSFCVMGYRFGETLVWERRADNKIYPFKASGAKIGKMAFLRRDHNNGDVLVSIDRDRLWPLAHTGTDVSEVQNRGLQEALEFQLHREAESAERREVSREIRDTKDLGDNQVTTHELESGRAGTCLMDYGLSHGGRRFNRIHPYRLSSDGSRVWVSEYTPGTLEKADPDKTWLRRETKEGTPSMLDPNNPLPLSELRKLREWKEASRANGHSEVRWQTELKTKELAATAINRGNILALVSVEDGRDGVYTFTTNVRRKSTAPKPYFVPGGFAVERKGSTVKIVWTTPNVQTEANRMGNEFVEITDLPPVWFYLLRSIYAGVSNFRELVEPTERAEFWRNAPSNLQQKPKETTGVGDDTQEETEE